MAQSGTDNSSVLIKIEPIKIPKTDGSPETWSHFWQRYNSLVHEIPDAQMPKVIKWAKLAESLTGNAAEFIRQYQQVAEDYEIAIEALKEAYGNENRIKQFHLEKLDALKPPKNYDLAALKKFSMDLTVALGTLKGLEGDPGEMAFLTLRKKLPYFVQTPLESEKKAEMLGEKPWDLYELSDWLNRFV